MTQTRLLRHTVILSLALVAFGILAFGIHAQSVLGQGTQKSCPEHYSLKNGDCVCDFGQFEAPIGDLEGDVCDFIGEGKTPLLTLFTTLAKFFMGIVLATGVMMVIVAGYFYMTAGGSAEQVGKAKKMIVAALLGIILALASFMILNTISPQFASEVQEPSFSSPAPAR